MNDSKRIPFENNANKRLLQDNNFITNFFEIIMISPPENKAKDSINLQKGCFTWLPKNFKYHDNVQ